MTKENFKEFRRLAGELPVNAINTQLLTLVLGEAPEIDCYSTADEDLNRSLNQAQRSAFFEGVEEQIKNLNKNVMYDGRWESSDYFNWTAFSYTENKDGRYSSEDVAIALREQRPYFDKFQIP